MIGPMRLFKRGDTYYVEFERGKKRSLKTGDKKVAEGIFRKLKAEWLAGRLVQLDADQHTSLGDFVKEYLRTRESMSLDTYRHDTISLRQLIDVLGASTPMRLINAKRIEEFKTVTLARGVRPVSVNSYLRHIKSALSTAEEWGVIEQRPKFKMCKVPKHLPRFLRPEEIKALLDYAMEHKPEFYRMLVVYLWTGARRTELLALKWSDCHLEGDKPYLILTGKGDKQRSVPVLPQVMEVLEPHRKDLGHVFRQVSPITVSWWYKTSAKACGLDSHLHDLRHTAATYMLMSGVPMRVVQEILGHASIITTEVYGQVVKEHLHREMEKLRFE